MQLYECRQAGPHVGADLSRLEVFAMGEWVARLCGAWHNGDGRFRLRTQSVSVSHAIACHSSKQYCQNARAERLDRCRTGLGPHARRSVRRDAPRAPGARARAWLSNRALNGEISRAVGCGGAAKQPAVIPGLDCLTQLNCFSLQDRLRRWRSRRPQPRQRCRPLRAPFSPQPTSSAPTPPRSRPSPSRPSTITSTRVTLTAG